MSSRPGLAVRSTEAELMDSDCENFEDYSRCLGDLAKVNTVTLTYGPTLAWLTRVTQGMDRFSLLDVACGHGDGLRRIARWARKRGLQAKLTGIDLNPWATRAAQAATEDTTIRYVTADVFAWRPDPPPDIIVTSQFTHHLDSPSIIRLLQWMEATAARGWFVADLHRHWLAYYGFPVLARLASWHRFVRNDGQVSIARSFRKSEWRTLLADAGFASEDVSVNWRMPFRICLARDKCARR